MLKPVNCPVCHEEVEISEEIEAVPVGCPVCGKSVTVFMCSHCNSEFTSADVGETSECMVQET